MSTVYAHHWGRTGDCLQRCLDDSPGGSDIVLVGTFHAITPTVVRLPKHRSTRIHGEANAVPRYVTSSGGALIKAAPHATGTLLAIVGESENEVRAEFSLERVKIDGCQSSCDRLLYIDNCKDVLLNRVYVQRSKGTGVHIGKNHQVHVEYLETHQCKGIGFFGQSGGDCTGVFIKAAGCETGIKLGSGWTVAGELRAYLNRSTGIHLAGRRIFATLVHANDNKECGVRVSSDEVTMLAVILKDNDLVVDPWVEPTRIFIGPTQKS